MSLRILALFALILACLTHPALSLGQDSKSPPSDEILRKSKPADFNTSIYYKNKREFSLETGWLPINIPWPFDFLLGDKYDETPLKYTLVPTIASLRWQMDDVGGPSVLRGNWDLTLSGSLTAIPRGPETRYGAYDMGIRRNFVRPNWRIAPYFDLRLGLGGGMFQQNFGREGDAKHEEQELARVHPSPTVRVGQSLRSSGIVLEPR